MTKEKIGVADKIGGIEPLLGSASSGRGLACKEIVSTICGHPRVKLGLASFEQRGRFSRLSDCRGPLVPGRTGPLDTLTMSACK